ncbi:MAG: hypothetical protein WKG07_05390 [Hymenobacter sp.]
MPRDERAALIRTEQRTIKQATAQFNASGNAATLPGTPQPEEPWPRPPRSPPTALRPATPPPPLRPPSLDSRPVGDPAAGPTPAPAPAGWATSRCC